MIETEIRCNCPFEVLEEETTDEDCDFCQLQVGIELTTNRVYTNKKEGLWGIYRESRDYLRNGGK
jgi:hypothetical protein